MMKTFKYILSTFLVIAVIWSCTDDELNNLDFLDTVVAPTNVDALFTITQDNSGLVSMIPSGDGAVQFVIDYGDGTGTPATLKPGEKADHTYAEGSYSVNIMAKGITGLTTSVAKDLLVSFQAPVFGTEPIIENDAAVSKQVNVTVPDDAQFAMFFDVSFVEDGIETVVTGNVGDTVSYVYANAGMVDIKVVLKGGAIETVEYVLEGFEVTEILQPLASALTPASRNEVDYISIFSDSYTTIEGSDYNPNWGQQTGYNLFDLNGDEMLQYSTLNYQGINIGETIDVTAMEYLHVDIWTPALASVDIYPLQVGVPAEDEKFKTLDLVEGEWSSFDIPLSFFTDQGLAIDQIHQFKFVGENSGTIFVDNLYFWRQETAVVQALIYDDFEGNGNITTWAGDDCGMDNNFPNPFMDINNSSATVLKYDDTGGTYANVRFDASSNFDLTVDNTFTLKIYVPSSGITGAQSNQISLKLQDGTVGAPWETQTEIIKTVVLDTWQEITFDFANDETAGAGDPLSRGDFNRVVLQVNSEGNNDSVIAYIDDFNYGVDTSVAPFDGGLVINGDFENGAEPWTIGVGADPVPVIANGGNSYYSVEVPTAGQPYEVNASQKLEIIEGETYTMSFEAWSDTDRPILPGIGLSADPWTNVTEEVNITTTKQTYTITLTANAGASDARVFFDLGAAVGSVNIDNVSLFLVATPFDGGLVINGDFESGAEPWTIGVGTDPVPVVTDGTNSYYSVEVTTAGQPYEVNASQKLEIIEGETYTMSFEAWSDTDRPILPGIGLSADPWTNVTEEVNITTTKQTYTITLVANAGASDARVFFDLGAAVGSVNIDNVSLFIAN